MSNLIPISNTIAERFLYLPMVGFAFLLAKGIELWKNREEKRGQIKRFGIILSIILVVLYFRTFTSSLRWWSDRILFSTVEANEYCSPIAHNNLSIYYNNVGLAKKSQEEYLKHVACVDFIWQYYHKLQAEYLKK